MSEPVGRPLKFSTPEELQEQIDNYLESTEREEYTVTGLALAIGTNRQVLMDYENREGYAHIVKRAKCIIENAYELSLRKSGRSGDIFALKNFGWKDKQEIEHGGDIKVTKVVHEVVGGN